MKTIRKKQNNINYHEHSNNNDDNYNNHTYRNNNYCEIYISYASNV